MSTRHYDSTQYDPQNDAFDPIAEGDYNFAVTDARATTSKNDNQMIKLTLEVTVGRDEPIRVFDRLVAVDTALWKIHNFCEATGLDYHSGELLPEHCLGRQGRAHFVLGEPNRKGRQYLEVGRYLEPTETSADASAGPTGEQDEAHATAGESTDSDDLPF